MNKKDFFVGSILLGMFVAIIGLIFLAMKIVSENMMEERPPVSSVLCGAIAFVLFVLLVQPEKIETWIAHQIKVRERLKIKSKPQLVLIHGGKGQNERI